MTDAQSELARQMGSDHPPLGIHVEPECAGCVHRLHEQECEFCRHYKNANPNDAVWRRIAWIRKSLDVIQKADHCRMKHHRPLSDPPFQANIKQALRDFNEDGEKLFSLLCRPDAEEAAGELGVATAVKGGGQ